MSHRTKKTLAVLGTGAVAAAAAFAVPAGAQSANTITVKGGSKMKPGSHIIDTQRFRPFNKSVKSGSTVTIANKSKSREPHTLSLVKASVLPKNMGQMEAFFGGKTMRDFMQAHEVDPENEEAPPGKMRVDVGEEGFDQPGDSVFFAGPAPTKIKVTAKKGTTLSYICLIHPWMQGKIKTN